MSDTSGIPVDVERRLEQRDWIDAEALYVKRRRVDFEQLVKIVPTHHDNGCREPES
ncbi:hypothetical protein PQR64_23250 [Paraburkholderia phytofirmans]|uniref:hypothetical protein n=1 Tax=Paraburkholderia phytofirmans TaxID=261302 RepID=UPI0038BE0070